jgi:cytochrome b subunit of formate dehydrogenase
MNENKASQLPVILVTYALLIVYNALYWSGKFLGFPEFFYLEVAKHWKLITFLEFLAVASVIVDIIVQFDRFSIKQARIRMVVSAILGVLLGLRILIGIIELYMRGEVGG